MLLVSQFYMVYQHYSLSAENESSVKNCCAQFFKVFDTIFRDIVRLVSNILLHTRNALFTHDRQQTLDPSISTKNRMNVKKFALQRMIFVNYFQKGSIT